MITKMQKPSTGVLKKLPGSVALKIARCFKIPEHEENLFYEYLVSRISKILERAPITKPSVALRKAATATRALQKEFDNMQEEDRDCIERIVGHSTLWGEGSFEVKSAIKNLNIVFNHAVGKSAPVSRGSIKLNRMLGVQPLAVKDQPFKEIVFALMAAATEHRGKFTLDSTCKTGSLIDALDFIRPYLPDGAVPNEPPAGTIQKIKKQFLQMRS